MTFWHCKVGLAVNKDSTVLIVSHGHPDFSKGGGEIAAYNLHKALNRLHDTGDGQCKSVFFARHDQPGRLHGGTPLSGTGRPAEILFYSKTPDWFLFQQPDKTRIWRDFRQVLETVKPDIVHFHHYVHLGIELIGEVKRVNPDAKIVLTLHEFFGICHNHGQMVKTSDRSLCFNATPADCANCFPQYSPQDFYWRENFIKSWFSHVDQFVSPSHFLADRYIQWGLPAEKMQVIENLLESGNDHLPAIQHDTDRPVRIGFFGQINWFKGLDVLLEAVLMLPAEVREQLHLTINGSGLEQQPFRLRTRIRSQLWRLGSTVLLRGKYEPEELPRLMATTDWLVIPSRWWENSPMVIQEARKFGVPVICSHIGGMAEKVEHGRTGLHFLTGRADSLAEQLHFVVQHRHEQPGFSDNMRDSYQATRPVDEHLGLYQMLVQANNTTNLKAA